MSSINYKSDLKKVMNFLEESLNVEFETNKKFPTNPTFSKGIFQNNSSEEVNPYSNKEPQQAPVNYVNDYQDEYRDGYEDGYVDMYGDSNPSDYDNLQTNMTGDSKYWQDSQEALLDVQSNITLSKKISRSKLREAVVWSEILGKPISKRRRDKTNRYRQTY